MVFAAVGQIKVFDWLYVDADIPVAYGSVSRTTEQLSNLAVPPDLADQTTTKFAIGNPTLGAHYAGMLSKDFAFFGGLTVSIPILQEPDTNVSQEEYEKELLPITQNALGRVFFDTQRLLTGYLPLRARGGVEIRILPFLHYRGDAGLMFAIPTGDGGAQPIIEQSNEIEVRANIGIGGGIRFQEAFTVRLKVPDDKAHTAAEPFIGFEPAGLPFYGRVGYLVALDEVLGFGLSQGKIATLRVAAGGKF
jgi:hypothetical protein